jgi:processive 1,2-diacylglycerol beta-glucosyltransferase
MVRLRDKDTGADLGEISDEEMQFLQDQLEEESAEDVDYYINREELEVWRAAGSAPPTLLDMLQRAMGDREGIEVALSEE